MVFLSVSISIWNLIKEDLLEVFQFLHQSEDIEALKYINYTFITLIPKKLNAEKVQVHNQEVWQYKHKEPEKREERPIIRRRKKIRMPIRVTE